MYKNLGVFYIMLGVATLLAGLGGILWAYSRLVAAKGPKQQRRSRLGSIELKNEQGMSDHPLSLFQPAGSTRETERSPSSGGSPISRFGSLVGIVLAGSRVSTANIGEQSMVPSAPRRRNESFCLTRTGVSEEHNQVAVVGSVGCRVVAVNACHHRDIAWCGCR